MKLLVVGGGGREHAIIRSLKKNPTVTEIFACEVFNDSVMRSKLPKAIYKTLKETVRGEKYYMLFHVIGFCLFVMVHLFFRMVEHHIEEQSKNDEPTQKIERAKVTWR